MLILWLIALAGLAGSSVYLALVLLAAGKFRRGGETASSCTRPVTLLKPLHGEEPGLEENLESFFRQEYPQFEIIFGARHAGDPALACVARLRERYPQVPVTFVLSGEPQHPNAKLCTLKRMIAAARHDLLIISDSDVRVGPRYIEIIAAPLLEPAVGMVTCVYRGVSPGGFWPLLEALGMSVEMTSGVLVAEMLEGMKFALGPTMAIRRDVLEKIGGVEPLVDFCADDYLLGKLTAEAGYKVVLSRYVIDHVVLNPTMRRSLQHQARWMRSTRFSREWGHIGTGLTFSVPFGLAALAAGLASSHAALGTGLLAWALLNRVILSLVAGGGIVRDPNAVRYCWLYPLRDLLGFLLWVWSFLGTTVVWRGERYRLLPGGRMVRTEASAVSPKASPAAPPSGK